MKPDSRRLFPGNLEMRMHACTNGSSDIKDFDQMSAYLADIWLNHLGNDTAAPTSGSDDPKYMEKSEDKNRVKKSMMDNWLIKHSENNLSKSDPDPEPSKPAKTNKGKSRKSKNKKRSRSENKGLGVDYDEKYEFDKIKVCSIHLKFIIVLFLQIPSDLVETFEEKTIATTQNRKETLGLLCGPLDDTSITHLVIPKQIQTASSCEPEDMGPVTKYLDDENKRVYGWIHTHPFPHERMFQHLLPIILLCDICSLHELVRC